jgi:hypothetical protein
MTAGVAAVVVVFSPASNVRFVDKMELPDSLMSTSRRVAPVAAVVTLPLTDVRVYAYGILNVALVPVDKSDVSSEHAIIMASPAPCPE